MGSNNKTYHNLSTQRCVLAKQTDPFIVTKQWTAARCFCLLWIITQLFNNCWVSLGAAHHCARIFQFLFGADVAKWYEMISSCLISVNCAGLGRILTGWKPAYSHRCSPYQGSGEMNSQTFFTNLFWSPPGIHTRYSMQDGKFVAAKLFWQNLVLSKRRMFHPRVCCWVPKVESTYHFTNKRIEVLNQNPRKYRENQDLSISPEA